VKQALKIISGGQTGVDRAALDAALDAGVACGGWCPADRSAEDGIISDHYPLQPLPDGGVNDERTRRNVADSDGTVIFTFGQPAGGTETTRRTAVELNKPLLVIDTQITEPHAAVTEMRAFLRQHQGIHTLNIAGPRASEQPAIGAFVYRCVKALLKAPASQPPPS
jgi:predicted Rossmann fold nucleotide-binding protein DprA/Smf involved in DNA uptake